MQGHLVDLVAAEVDKIQGLMQAQEILLQCLLLKETLVEWLIQVQVILVVVAVEQLLLEIQDYLVIQLLLKGEQVELQV
tara:strand:+ start:63 stop:299 length:237 start_codon:yes stop_codon:yes gene_type:complete